MYNFREASIYNEIKNFNKQTQMKISTIYAKKIFMDGCEFYLIKLYSRLTKEEIFIKLRIDEIPVLKILETRKFIKDFLINECEKQSRFIING